LKERACEFAQGANMPKVNSRNIIFSALGLIALVAVFLLIKFTATKQHSLKIAAIPAPRPAISDADYRAAVVSAFSVFKNNDFVSAESVRDRLLSLIVPVEEKETHLALVLKLTAYDDALRSGDGADKIYKNLIALADKNQWLKSVAPFSSQ
jgi:hypothetical protein